MTTFAVTVVVRCSEDHCIYETQEGYCKFARVRGLTAGTRNYCNLFDKDLVGVPGIPSPLRCSACLLAEKQVKGKQA